MSEPIYKNKSISDNVSIFSQTGEINSITPLRGAEYSNHHQRGASNKLSSPILSKNRDFRQYMNLSYNYQSDCEQRDFDPYKRNK